MVRGENRDQNRKARKGRGEREKARDGHQRVKWKEAHEGKSAGADWHVRASSVFFEQELIHLVQIYPAHKDQNELIQNHNRMPDIGLTVRCIIGSAGANALFADGRLAFDSPIGSSICRAFFT